MVPQLQMWSIAFVETAYKLNCKCDQPLMLQLHMYELQMYNSNCESCKCSLNHLWQKSVDASFDASWLIRLSGDKTVDRQTYIPVQCPSTLTQCHRIDTVVTYFVWSPQRLAGGGRRPPTVRSQHTCPAGRDGRGPKAPFLRVYLKYKASTLLSTERASLQCFF